MNKFALPLVAVFIAVAMSNASMAADENANDGANDFVYPSILQVWGGLGTDSELGRVFGPVNDEDEMMAVVGVSMQHNSGVFGNITNRLGKEASEVGDDMITGEVGYRMPLTESTQAWLSAGFTAIGDQYRGSMWQSDDSVDIGVGATTVFSLDSFNIRPFAKATMHVMDERSYGDDAEVKDASIITTEIGSQVSKSFNDFSLHLTGSIRGHGENDFLEDGSDIADSARLEVAGMTSIGESTVVKASFAHLYKFGDDDDESLLSNGEKDTSAMINFILDL